LILTFFRCRNFRNLQPLDWALPTGLLVVTGANGAGKSNLLEALTVFGNLTSFRSSAPRLWISHGQTSYFLRGQVQGEGGGFLLEQQGHLAKGFTRELRKSGRKVPPAEYLPLFPVAALSAADGDLVLGGPEHRRRFLDRLAFLLQPATLDLLLRYRRALRQRNKLLQEGQGGEALAAFERELAQAGAALVTHRQAALKLLQQAFQEELEELPWLLPKPLLRYHEGEGSAASAAGDAHQLLLLLRRYRPQELARGHTLVGPHRHDLLITLQGRPAREQLSAGQAKLLATALRLAAVRVATHRRGEAPLVAFDDVDAELDKDNLGHLLRRLSCLGPQVVLSTAHPEVLLPLLPEATVVRLAGGAFVNQ
jgi:DNA replication and repair protein RecF